MSNEIRLSRARGLLRFCGLAAAMAFAGVPPGAWAEPPVPLTVQLDWKPGVQFAGLLVAQERGWYRDAGLDVTIRANDFKRSYIDVVAEDDHTIGTSESRSLVTARVQGAPIRAVATMFQGSPTVLISRQSSGILRVADLAGKKIGVHRREDVSMLEHVFALASMPDPHCEWKKVGFELKEFLAGEVDAVQGYAMDEPVRLTEQGVEVNVLPLADNGWVDYSQVLFTSEALLAKDPAALGKFLEATFRGWRAALADIPGTARLICEKYTPGLPPASAERSLRLVGPFLTKESPHMGTMRLETWKQIIPLVPGNEHAVRPARVDDLVDFRFMPELDHAR